MLVPEKRLGPQSNNADIREKCAQGGHRHRLEQCHSMADNRVPGSLSSVQTSNLDNKTTCPKERDEVRHLYLHVLWTMTLLFYLVFRDFEPL